MKHLSVHKTDGEWIVEETDVPALQSMVRIRCRMLEMHRETIVKLQTELREARFSYLADKSLLMSKVEFHQRKCDMLVRMATRAEKARDRLKVAVLLLSLATMGLLGVLTTGQ